MAKKIFAGHVLRKVREGQRLTQMEFAKRLGLSASYVNQLEANQRPLSAAVLLSVGRVFSVDMASFEADDLDRIVADLGEALADPMFRGAKPGLQDLKSVATHAPDFAKAFLDLHGAMRRVLEHQASVDDVINAHGNPPRAEARAALPYEEVRDHFHYIDNYVDALDRAAERTAGELGLAWSQEKARLIGERLETLHGVAVSVTDAADPHGLILRFDPARRMASVALSLPQSTRDFLLAGLLARFEAAEIIDDHVVKAGFRAQGAEEVCRLALRNHYAGALLLPYQAFLDLARSTRHDLDRMQIVTGASLEQVGHRLSTLQRPGNKGIPFYFLKVDRAGNVIKRHSATRFQFARYGGACPMWNVHEAFERLPARTLVQIGEMPDGSRYLCLARSTVKPPTSHQTRERRYALGLGCEISYASEIVYADGLAIGEKSEVAKIGINCRICPRDDCLERAFPAVDRKIELDPDARGVVPFTLT